MKKCFNVLLTAAMIAMGLVISSCEKDNTTPETPDAPQWDKQAKYTIMFYGCGGGDIDEQLEGALEDLVKELGVEKNQVRYTVMYSMSATDKEFLKTYRGEKGKTYRYELHKNTDLTKEGYRSKYFYKNASEVELYKASTLADFIKWSKETAPADNYILELVNHGGGFDLSTEVLTKGIIYDDNHLDADKQGIGVSIATIAEALKTTNTHLKAIYWNGCMMGLLEVLTEVAPYCDYQFASSHVARSDSHHVVDLVRTLNSQPDDFEKMAEEHASMLIGDGEDDADSMLYPFKYATDKQGKPKKENCDMGCWKSSKLADINAQVKKLGELLVKAYQSYKLSVDTATSWVYLYELSYGYADVLDYALKLEECLNDEDLKAEAHTIATDLSKAIDAASMYRINGVFVKDAHGKDVAPKTGGFSLGISLYAGQREDEYSYDDKGKARYKASAFDKAVGWSKWMDINEFRVSADQEHPNITNPANDSSRELFWLDY